MRIVLYFILQLVFLSSYCQNYLKLTNIDNGKVAMIKEGTEIKFKVRTGDPASFSAGPYHKGKITSITDSMVVINGYGIPYYELTTIKRQSALRETGRIAGLALSPLLLRAGLLFIGLGIQAAASGSPEIAAIGFGGGVVLSAAAIVPYFLDARVYDLEEEWDIEPEFRIQVPADNLY